MTVWAMLMFLVTGGAALLVRSAALRPLLFNLVNLSFVGFAFAEASTTRAQGLGLFACLLIGTVACYFLASSFDKRRTPLSRWLAFGAPLGLLILVKSMPALAVLGVSYLAFRLSYFVFELEQERFAMPSLIDYVGFGCFFPTLILGPISPYSWHGASPCALTWRRDVATRALGRIVVGTTKFMFLANLFASLTFSGLWSDYKVHGAVDFWVSCVSFYLYAYCNFSGFCDVAIGVSALLGVRVKENFDNPFAARNIQDFWNRWHITLSEYMRDVLFLPMNIGLVRRLGPRYGVVITPLVGLFVFVLVGLWHGIGWNYVIFGCLHGAALAVNFFYGIALRRVLKDKVRAYQANPWIRAVATAATFTFIAFSMCFFENDLKQITRIYESFVG